MVLNLIVVVVSMHNSTTFLLQKTITDCIYKKNSAITLQFHSHITDLYVTYFVESSLNILDREEGGLEQLR